jgi:hypothetical protein
MMEAASTSETSVNFYHTGATTQKTAIFTINLGFHLMHQTNFHTHRNEQVKL